MLFRVSAVKHLPVQYSADFIFWSFGIAELILNQFENRVSLKPLLGVVPSFAHIITGHGQTQLNQVCCFHFFGVFLASKGSKYSELIDSLVTNQSAEVSPFHLKSKHIPNRLHQ